VCSSDLAGNRGWGYDGVGWFAVQDAYGGPDAYRRFVDAAHAVGLGVIQDVVYNHFGPVGNYLTKFGPYLAETDGAWGSQVNLDGPGSTEVRRFIADNVRYWFVEAHVDGLRLDAVHALHDSSPTHLMEELAMVTNDLAAHLRRPLALIAESDANDPRIITPRQAGGYGVDAVWSDDFHHALHTALTGETDGYYVDYTGLAALAKACERGFVHDGTWSRFRGRRYGAPLDITRVPGWRLVVAATNHDQVGNRPRGDRPQLSPDQHAAAALLTLTSGNTPLLFMGQEWGASTPFGYFCDYDDPALIEAIRQGRQAEFATAGWDADDLPDPLDVATFAAAKLRWDEAGEPDHAAVRQSYRQLLALRRQYSELTNPVMARTRCTFDDTAGWFLMRRGGLAIAVNFSAAEVRVDLGGPHMLRWAGPSGARPEADAVILPPGAAALLIPLEE
jgi:maltooligosyltrehalose trehalohydrolase